MTDREKLIQLLIDSPGLDTFLGDYDRDADFLLANGVTFATDTNVGSKWIPVTERLPNECVSVLGYMTDAGEFPPVRECYLFRRAFFFPALRDCHPVSHWMEMPEPPVCEIAEYMESCEECGFCKMNGGADHEN